LGKAELINEKLAEPLTPNAPSILMMNNANVTVDLELGDYPKRNIRNIKKIQTNRIFLILLFI